MAQEVQNVMKEIRLDKVVLNMGLGKSGDAVEIAKKALGEISNKKVNDRPAKKAIRDWGIRKGEPIGAAVTVRGNDAEFNVAIIRSDGEAYNFITGVFGGDNPVLTNQTATVSVPFKRSIVFPATSTNYTYDITVTPTGGDIIPRPDTPGATIPTAYGDEGINTNGTRFVDGVSGTYNINQYAATTLTFTADDGALSGYTISSGLTAPGAWSAQGGKEWFEGRQLPVWTGTFVKDDGSVLYNDGLDDAD